MLPFQLIQATTTALPIIASLPHCGVAVPDSLRAGRGTVDPGLDTDAPLDRLLDFLPDVGVTLLAATYSRYVVDVNRPVVDPVPGAYKTSVIPDHDAAGWALFPEYPTEEELQDRIYRYYIPYHEALYALLTERVRTFGSALLVDLHSFDSIVSSADIVIGDGCGQYCSEAVSACFEKHHGRVGLETRRNSPFSAGYSVRHYTRIPGVAAIHLEIARRTFSDPLFDAARERYRLVYRSIVEETTSVLPPSRFLNR